MIEMKPDPGTPNRWEKIKLKAKTNTGRLMKTIAFLLYCGIMVMPAFAQGAETLIHGKVESGGFGGPVVKFTEINDEFGLLVGGRGGYLLNHTFAIGGGGYGLVNNIEVVHRVADRFLNFGYGGLELEYIVASRKLIHLSVQTLIGAGGVSFRNRDFERIDGPDDAFFVAEPGVNLILNVTEFFRIGFGGSYRWIRGIDFLVISDTGLSGASATLTFKFGKF